MPVPRRPASCGSSTAVGARANGALDHPCGRQLAEDILAVPSPLVGRARWHDVAWSGGTEHTMIRNICCLWYQLPGGGLCLTCPRASVDDRRRTLEQARR